MEGARAPCALHGLTLYHPREETRMPDNLPDILWPTPADVQNVFVAAGLITPPLPPQLAAYDWQGGIDAVVSEWELACGFSPFLAPAGEMTRRFPTPDVYSAGSDPWGSPTRLLALPVGLVSVSAIRVQPPTTFGAVAPGAEGVPLADGRDYHLLPMGAPDDGQPYTHIAFTSGHSWAAPGGESGVIEVTGRFGFCASLPPAVRKVVLDLAACEAAPTVLSSRFLAAGGLVGMKKRKKVGDVETEVSASAHVGGALPWADEAHRAALRRKFAAMAWQYRTPVMA